MSSNNGNYRNGEEIHNLYPLEPAAYLDEAPEAAAIGQATLKLANKALQGSLEHQEAASYLLDSAPGGRLPSAEHQILQDKGRETNALTASELTDFAQALRLSMEDATGRLSQEGAANDEASAFQDALQLTAANLIRERSQLQRQFGKWLTADEDRQLAGTAASAKEAVMHRLHEAEADPWEMPAKLEAVRRDLESLEGGDSLPGFTAGSMTVNAEGRDRNLNWLVPNLPDPQDIEAAGNYLAGQMALHEIGALGRISPESFAAAVIDPHVDRELAASCRRGPTSYAPIPRSPQPEGDAAEPMNHAKASYAWLLRDALSHEKLAREAWSGNAEEMALQAAEAARRLQGLASFSRNHGERQAAEGTFESPLDWRNGDGDNYETVAALTGNGRDLNPILDELNRMEDFMEIRLLAEQDNPLWSGAADYDSPAALLLQETIANACEVRLALAKIAAETEAKEEAEAERNTAFEELENLYTRQGIPKNQAADQLNGIRMAAAPPPEAEDRSGGYVRRNLQSIAARMAHMHFNLEAIEAERIRS